MTDTDQPTSPANPLIRPRTRDAILNPLRAGLVPRSGFEHIQVGRVREVAAIASDLSRTADGGCSVRFVLGDPGSGKTFYLKLAQSVALEQNFVTVTADLTADRHLHSRQGAARALYAALMVTASTRGNIDSGLPTIVERFISSARAEADSVQVDVAEVMSQRLAALQRMPLGFDFAHVLRHYWEGFRSADEVAMNDAIRWLRAEFSSRREAAAALPVRTIISDANFWDALKLLAAFVRLAGFSGLLITLDEMGLLAKQANSVSRKNDYEQVLRIVNDCLQGDAEGIMVCFAGTLELTDTFRGLYSYPALRSRLQESPYATPDRIDLSGPVIRLADLAPEEQYLLTTRLQHVHAFGDPSRYRLPDEALIRFLSQHVRPGDAQFRNPRDLVRQLVQVLDALEQDPDATWHEILGRSSDSGQDDAASTLPTPGKQLAGGSDDPVPGGTDGHDDLASFRL